MDLQFGKIKNVVFLDEVNFKTLHSLIWIWLSKPKIDCVSGPTCDFILSIVGLSVLVAAFRIFDSN